MHRPGVFVGKPFISKHVGIMLGLKRFPLIRADLRVLSLQGLGMTQLWNHWARYRGSRF
jgi:hypothetical protein